MYRHLMTVIGVLALALGAFLIVAPQMYLALYLPVYGPDFAFAAQRFAPAIMGLGAVLLAARGLPAGPFAHALAWIAAAVWAGVAATGVYHFATGVATPAILVAAATELGLAALFALAARGVRPQ